ncbi:TetR/AcrR family transcriptional regulator [Nakamurella sp. PAMC28650]|uniref:TetR/AcrR family transcriptional regulator n=1 Tax=Nakamurella sp. PAMC28650 TaxID=2762325 RepID=UPI00164D3880|nr:helix-turn-helix domain-containing protein [Nakamurella sp. PAMC28650]QNK82095.1 helix-turn-helix transcriptional regulator [Nakamurella sp. PAMC28650]
MSQHPAGAIELPRTVGPQRGREPHPPDPVGVTALGQINRSEILLAAAAVIELRGIREFTVRGLADQLGLPVAALTRMFGTRDELLDGIVEVVIDEVYADPDIQTDTAQWQEYLQRVAHGVRRVARGHPHVFAVTGQVSPR